MRDLLVITPSRGRPAELARLVGAVRATRRSDTVIAVAVDSDDPKVEQYTRFFTGQADTDLWWHIGTRNTLSGWTNELALRYAARFTALASFGDDHLPGGRDPVVPGWDAKLLETLAGIGGSGIVYGNDLYQGSGLPTAPVISSDIVRALGWFCLPSLRHYFVDNVWYVLGQSAGCLAYRHDAIVEHLHPCAGKAPWDPTYVEAGAMSVFTHQDRAGFDTWLAGPCQQHFEIVRKVVASRVS